MDDKPERMWPLDVSIAALAGLVLFLIVTRLRFDDPRWLFNAWTYALAVPLIAVGLAFFSHGLVNRHVQKSIQIGFLFSVFVHLLLLALAINVIIFTRYFPDAFAGIKTEREPLARTIPEYVFRSPEQTVTTPDWSQPVDAETASRVVPLEQRQVPPLEQTQPRLELPSTQPPTRDPLPALLVERNQNAQTQPRPADRPSSLARRQTTDPLASVAASQSPTAPEVPVQQELQDSASQRPIAHPQRSEQSSVSLASPANVRVELEAPLERTLPNNRRSNPELPQLSQSAVRQQEQRPTAPRPPAAAGSTPTPQTVAIARPEPTSNLLIQPAEMASSRKGTAAAAELAIGESPSPPATEQTVPSSALEVPRATATASGALPDVTAGRSGRSTNRLSQTAARSGVGPVGLPGARRTGPPTPYRDASDEGVASDRSGDLPTAARSRGSQASSDPSMDLDPGGPDLAETLGPIGLSAQRNVDTGIVGPQELPKIASLDPLRRRRARRDVGGEATPYGAKVAAVESFSRRVTRTRGGAPPAPGGMVGQETEEAIERGLAYLAGIQNADGSWSLQGHGTDVILRSDSAATGLCLLAFQGAGYTHRQHQYADTVSRGLKFLVENQRTNGDLYRPENQLSDQNVALYSHGIASLALCEAFGMTQDDELRESAQGCLNYIAGTQHRQRGGWRYTPQISADTSVTGWMMMALKSGQLAGLDVNDETYRGIQKWLSLSQVPQRPDRYRYNPYAPDTPAQRHGRFATPTMTSVGMLMRMYSGWRRDNRAMRSAASYLLQYPPQIGTQRSPQRDTYYWYYATQVMFHMGGSEWKQWNAYLKPLLVDSQIRNGPYAGSWDPASPVPDRWGAHAGRLYVTTMNLLNLEVYYRHLPIYEDTAYEDTAE